MDSSASSSRRDRRRRWTWAAPHASRSRSARPGPPGRRPHPPARGGAAAADQEQYFPADRTGPERGPPPRSSCSPAQAVTQAACRGGKLHKERQRRRGPAVGPKFFARYRYTGDVAIIPPIVPPLLPLRQNDERPPTDGGTWARISQRGSFGKVTNAEKWGDYRGEKPTW